MLDFASFQSSFKGDLCKPDDTGYAEAIARWATNAQRKAQIVAFVKDSEDVALSIAYARSNDVPIAIRGGGHSTSGASSTDGLVIDLSRYMKVVKVDTEKQLVYAGGGATWGDVDKAAIQHGLATVGGSINHTGIGGLTLGGGIGWLSGAHGHVIDNLVQATVVDSHGTVLTASLTENPELFWGIRGGGCNFGVVTEFVLKLHPQRRTVYAGGVIYSFEVLEQLVPLINSWLESAKENEGMICILAKALQGPPVPIVWLALFYNGSEAEGRENFKAFFELKPIIDLTKEIPYEDLNAMHNHMMQHGQARLIKGAFQLRLDFPSVKRALERVVALSDDEHTPILIMDLYPLKKICSVPNGTCAYVRSEATNITTITTWSNDTPENLAKARSLSKELTGIIIDAQKTHFKVNQGYGNYDQDGTGEMDAATASSKAEVLFGVNYPRLQKLKGVHDPHNIFSKWFPVAPLA